VIIEKGQPTRTATLLAGTSLSAFGAREINTLIPGTAVWLLIARHSPHAFILGVVPPAMTQATRSLMDWISRCSRNRVDIADKQPLLLKDNGGVTDWTAGRPFDGLLCGEAGWITETGLKITIDPFLVQLAVDESCGIFGFYHDQLLRSLQPGDVHGRLRAQRRQRRLRVQRLPGLHAVPVGAARAVHSR
jgi:hypothetical protein